MQKEFEIIFKQKTLHLLENSRKNSAENVPKRSKTFAKATMQHKNL